MGQKVIALEQTVVVVVEVVFVFQIRTGFPEAVVLVQILFYEQIWAESGCGRGSAE